MLLETGPADAGGCCCRSALGCPRAGGATAHVVISMQPGDGRPLPATKGDLKTQVAGATRHTASKQRRQGRAGHGEPTAAGPSRARRARPDPRKQMRKTQKDRCAGATRLRLRGEGQTNGPRAVRLTPGRRRDRDAPPRARSHGGKDEMQRQRQKGGHAVSDGPERPPP